MENKKCSSKKHLEIDAINYCQECKLYLCNKCKSSHSDLFENHHNLYNINEKADNIFIDICPLDNHHCKLEFFCKMHNQLCCLACISRIKNKYYGQHSNCNVCIIEDIKDEKKNKLKENIKCLENLSITLNNAINELKKLYEKINENKEELKLKIQKIFTKIRNTLNDREDELLLDIDNQFNNIFINEEIIRESEKMPNKVKMSLEKGKLIDNEWNNNNKLNSLINDCINIENNIKEIKIINENINKCNLNKNEKFRFSPEENEINAFLEKIKTFGKIYHNYKYKLRKCPKNISENRKYEIKGENENILIKTGTDGNWMGTICEKELEKEGEHKWKIKILKTTNNKNIMVGIASNDFDINSSTFNTCGYYLYCYSAYSNPVLYSGPPYNYSCKSTNLNKVKDEIIIIMNMNKRSLKFIIDNEDKGDSYTNIPIDKQIYPAILIYDQNDSIEIIEC